MLKLIVYDDQKHRNQKEIQESCRILDEVVCQFLPLPIVAKNPNLNAAEFLDPSSRTLPYTKTSLSSYYFEMWSPLSKVSITL